MTAASSESNDVGSAFVRLNLNLEEGMVLEGNDSKEVKRINMELKPKEFFKLLSELESARHCLQGVTSSEQ